MSDLIMENLIYIFAFLIIISFIRCRSHTQKQFRIEIINDLGVNIVRTVVSLISVCQDRSKRFFCHILDGRKNYPLTLIFHLTTQHIHDLKKPSSIYTTFPEYTYHPILYIFIVPSISFNMCCTSITYSMQFLADVIVNLSLWADGFL